MLNDAGLLTSPGVNMTCISSPSICCTSTAMIFEICRWKNRREILAEMIPVGRHIQFSQALPGEASAIFHLIDQAGMEGMVSKRRDSKYRSGMSTNWLKAKCYKVGEYGLLGVEREPGKPAFALMADR